MRHVFDFLTIYLVTFVIDHEVLKLNLYMSRLDTLWCINKSADFPRIGQFWILTYGSVFDPSDHLIFLELNTLRYNRTNNDNIKNSSMRVLKSYSKLINNAMGRRSLALEKGDKIRVYWWKICPWSQRDSVIRSNHKWLFAYNLKSLGFLGIKLMLFLLGGMFSIS